MAKFNRKCTCECTSSDSDGSDNAIRKVCVQFEEADSSSNESEEGRTEFADGDTQPDSCKSGSEYTQIIGPTAESILLNLQTLLNSSGLSNLRNHLKIKKKIKVKKRGRHRKSKKNCCCCRCDKKCEVGVTQSESCQACIQKSLKDLPSCSCQNHVLEVPSKSDPKIKSSCTCSEKFVKCSNKSLHQGDKKANYDFCLCDGDAVPENELDDLKSKKEVLSCQCLEQISDCSCERNIRYAITKITKFNHFTTFEIMKSTKRKPKQMPSFLEGVFVLKDC